MNKFILISLLLANPVYAYETGSMNCEQIGQYSAAVVHGKAQGTSYQKAMRIIKKTVPANYFIERRNLSEIVNAIYKKDWAKHLTEDGAYSSFKADCEVQQ